MPQIDQTSKIVRLQNPSAFFTKAIAMTAALLCALALGYVSQAESAVRSGDKADYYSKAQGKKKKKLSKLKRGARTNSSTARSARYLAQNDLESDLDSELESEIPDIRNSMLSAIGNIHRSQLLDKKLWDFSRLKKP